MAWENELAAAVDAVQRASRITRAVQDRLVAGMRIEKGDKSPVTVADFSAQAVVSHLLSQGFPEVPLVGEEGAEALRASDEMRGHVEDAVWTELPDLPSDGVLSAIDRGNFGGGPTGTHWALDPIDGTKGFLRLQQYAIALALIHEGEVVLGVLGCPSLPHDAARPDGARGALFWGAKGQGAHWRPVDGAAVQPVFVSQVASADQARFCESVEKGHTNQDHSALVAARLGIEQPPYRIDSQCKYAAVARGDASIYLRLPTRADYVERIWDHAAGVRVVEEAGGRVTDVLGAPLDFGKGRGLDANKGVVVTNGPLHDDTVAAVRAVLDL